MPSLLDRYATFIERRIQEGCGQVAQIHRELLEQGCQKSYETVRRYLMRLGYEARKSSEDKTAPKIGTAAEINRPVQSPPPSPRRASWWLLKTSEERKPEQQAFVEKLYTFRPVIEETIRLVEEFLRLVQHRQPEKLEAWLNRAERDPAVEIRGLAKSLRQDQDAVRAALELPWSTSPVEGQINRLKSIKRQMYGRAKFDLLRQRVLHRD